MNRVFRIIWSKALRAWVVTSELATSGGKGGGGCDEREGMNSSGHWAMRACVAAVLFALYAPAWAADRYWDVNGTAIGQGGTGTWNGSSLFWNSFNDGVTGPMVGWNNAAPGGDNAFFMGTAGTVTLAGPMTVHNLTFGVDGFTLTGGSLAFTGSTPTINVTAGTATIASTITGPANLTKSGGGTLSLTGTNTFTGNVNVTGGRLMLGSDAALGAAGNGITLANGTRVDSTGALASSRVITITSGRAVVGGGALSARITGAGGVQVTGAITNDANDFTGGVVFGAGTHSFSSVGNLGEASALGAATDATLGTIHSSAGGGLGNTLVYTGDGDRSDRNWQFNNTSSGGNSLQNQGTGTLTLTGNIFAAGANWTQMVFSATSADMELLGVISGAAGRQINYAGSAGRTITLGDANTYDGTTAISNITVRAGTLADAGTNSSLGSGSTIALGNGTLSYTGGATSTNRTVTVSGNSALRNDGTGGLAFTGPTSFVAGNPVDTFTLGGSFAGTNTYAGVISGAGSLAMNGAGTWLVSGDNTFTGNVTVQNGTLLAGHDNAFGTANALVVDGGTLDLGGFDVVAASLAGTGGTVDLDTGSLTIGADSGNTAYGGVIAGSGSLTKTGASTLTLSGANTYTGDTNVAGGTLALDFASASAPAANIISADSHLNLAGGSVSLIGADGEANSQAFDGVTVAAGNNTLRAASGTGGSMTVNLGAISHTGGILNFVAPGSGAFLTSTADGALGGWATVTNGTTTDYAEVVGGQIVAFNAYTNQDDASQWQSGQFISDEDGTANTAFFNTVSGSQQIAGLKYTAAANSIVAIDPGQTLGVDGTIIVNSTTGSANQTIQGGSLTGAAGGGTLGVLKNSAGTFLVSSDIVDNGGAVGFVVGGTGGGTADALGSGTVSLTGNNRYTGSTTVSGAALAFDSVANGGTASAIGASSSDSSNLVLENGTLRYTGTTATTDRGFTLVNAGSTRNIEVVEATTELTFTGQVTSPDDAGFTKTGAGTLTLANGGNDYIGATTISGGTLSVNTLADGGQASGIGAASADSANLVLQGGGTLRYTGATASSDRGFTVTSGLGGTIDVSNAATTLTLGGIATGDALLRKQGDGTLVLSGTNTYRGQTFVDAGTLRAGSTAAFGVANMMNLADAAGVTLDLDGFDNKVGGLQGGGASGGNVLLGDAMLTIGGNNGVYAGAISGSGGIIKENTSTQTMTGCNNTYTGTTTIRGGTLIVDCLADAGQASGIGASTDVSGGLVITGGASLDYTGGSVDIDRGLTVSGVGILDVTQAATTLTMSGAVVGSGTFAKDGAGTLVLSGDNTYAGTTLISNGTLRAGSDTALGNSGVRMGPAGTLLDLGGHDIGVSWIDDNVGNADAPTVGNIALGGNTLTITTGAAALGNGSVVNYAGVISGTGGIVKNGGSSQQFSGCNNTYTGATTINGGWIMVDCLTDGGLDSSIGASTSDAANLVLDGGRLRYLGAGDSTDRQFTVGQNHAWLDASGTGAIEFTSTAPVVFSGTGNRALTLGGISTDDNALAARIDNAAGGTTALTKEGTGTWVLRNTGSTYTGRTTINGGVLAVDKLADGGQASSIGMSGSAATNLVIGNGSTLRYTGAGDTTDRLFTLSTGVSFIESSGTGAITFSNTASASYSGGGARTLALGGTNTGLNTMGNTIVDQNATTGKTTLAKNDPGTWVLTGNNSYSGNTVINDGNLMIGNGGTSGNAGTGNVIVVNPTSTLSFNRSDSFDFTGTLSGLGNIAQVGTGTTVLTSAGNAIGGVTGVDAGVLQIDGGLTTGSAEIDAGELRVSASGTLTAPAIAMNDGSLLTVGGTVQGSGGVASTLTGDAGSATIDIASGGALRANGDLGDGADAVNVAGTLDTGAGALSLGTGDDTLTLRDGAVLAGLGVDGGAAGDDALVLDIAGAITFDGAKTTAFERLVKRNTGTATFTGAQAFAGGTSIEGGALDVAGDLLTPTVGLADGTALNLIAGAGVEAGGGIATTLTGSAGANTVTVAAGASLVASGDLGAGNDVLDVAGVLDTGAASLALGDGDDRLTIHDDTTLIGTVVAGSGNDTFDTNIAGVADLGAVQGFETLDKTGAGTLNINGPMGSDFATVNVRAGTLRITAPDGDVIAPPGLPITTTVSNGATLQVDGSYGCGAGNDSMTVAGAVTGSGTIGMCDGDDTLAVTDGGDFSGFTGVIDGGNAAVGDRVLLDNASALEFGVGNLVGFEILRKENTGEATLTGNQTYGNVVDINAGTLTVGAGASLNTPAVVLNGGTTLSVDGFLQGAGGGAANILGGNGVETVRIAGTANATGDLGAGDDVLDVSGVLTTSGSGFSLGAGNDRLIVHDGTFIGGTIDGGDGLDTRVYDIAGVATLGALANFEGVTKQGTGRLNIDGPGATDLQQVEVLGGTLSIGAGSSVTAKPGDSLAMRVGAGATLDVTTGGSIGCGLGADTLSIAGDLTGGGTVGLCDGDDTLTLTDGADLSGFTGVIDGGANGAGDRIVLASTGAMTADLGDAINFEFLQKDGAGEATLFGDVAFDAAQIDGGTLTIADNLVTSSVAMAGGTTLNVDGTLQAGAGVTTITGGAGVETVNIAGSAIATGDLGGGNDVLDVTGTLDTGPGMFGLGGGDDRFTVHDGTTVTGTVDGGAGFDTRVYDIDGTATLGALVNFEGITKTGTGTLEIAGPGATLVQDVQVLGGTLHVAAGGDVAGVRNAVVGSGATLDIDGNFDFTNDADTFTVAGAVTGTTLDLLGGDDTLTLQDGADLSGLANPIDGGAGTDTLVADLAGTATLGGATGFETLTKTNTGTLVVAGPAPSTFSTVNVIGGTLDVGPAGSLNGVVAGSIGNGATLNLDGTYTGTAGNDTLNVAGAITGAGSIALGDGDDALVLRDGADLGAHGGSIDGAAGTDHVVLDNAARLQMTGTLSNFEVLQKRNTGEAVLAGASTFTGGTRIDGGTLTVAGSLVTPTIAMADDTTLRIDGAVSGGSAATLTGSAGTNTVVVNGMATLDGDLGAGEDVLDVVGTLDTAAGALSLGDGDDRFVVHDDTVVTGTIDGGAGMDSRVYDIERTAEFGALLNFEGVTKLGGGTLDVSGPGTTALQSVEVLEGTLHVGAAGSIAAIAGAALDTVVAAGATLAVDGSFGCGASADRMTVGGTVSGSGTVAMCGGDDTLTLQDGATLATVIDGGADIDTVVLDNATAMSFDAAQTINFETLRKDGAGVATLTGDATFSHGTHIDGGTLAIDGALDTATVTMGDGTVLDVAGTLRSVGGGVATIDGSAGANTVVVSGTALLAGDLGDGNDVVDVTGTLDTGSGVLALGAGDDMLTIHDGTRLVGTVDAGQGVDTLNTDIATHADLGAVQGFESLRKTGAGTLDVNGPADSELTNVDIAAGTVHVTANGSIAARTTTVASGASLRVDGTYTGTSGDDTFTSMGTVAGAFSFGAGDDAVHFAAGDASGVIALDGGAGRDVVGFSGMQMSGAPSLTGWERVELRNGTTLALASALQLGGGTLAIDGTSTLLANAGAAIGGDVENAGAIELGMHRVAIGGRYASNGGTVRIGVSATQAGGMDVDGDVAGDTRVEFMGDGSDLSNAGPVLVVSSPNDDAATAGRFVPTDVEGGKVRVGGSVTPWSFDQNADRNWYLTPESAQLLPEVAGYGALPGLGAALSQHATSMAQQRLGDIRNIGRPACDQGVRDASTGGAGEGVVEDCHGAWVAATANELELGANPGFAVSGDDVGMYAGIDGDLERPNRAFRAGGYIGYTRGVYWSSGANSSGLAGMSQARIELDTPTVGMYASHLWNGGSFLDLSLAGSRPSADIRTPDGFTQRIVGNYLTFDARAGKAFSLDSGWTLEPQVELIASAVSWQDLVDAASRELHIDDAVVGTARAALRIEKAFTTNAGSRVRPWAKFAVQNIVGEQDSALDVRQAGSTATPQAFPTHDLGTSATLDVGVEAAVGRNVNVFGQLSASHELDGTDYEQRSATVGVNVRW
ncbi:autotransporter-associated beta strand repeat-containing protein [Lysobacter changpingensis]|uniref:autotransporter-associated beta strand repeat-containing protein n=1 Tax=Lysobacter changpingensis TaxID=2792784 RepID=UPI001A8C65FA|nr:autotransporter-associated beta strand repeat-containing protein [Lysobacter changpingensis]